MIFPQSNPITEPSHNQQQQEAVYLSKDDEN